MKKTTCRSAFLILIALSAGLFFASNEVLAYVYGRVGPGTDYPDDGTITYMAYLKKAGHTDNEIHTEDNWNAGLGTDNGYSSEWFFVDWQTFTLDLPVNDGDTMVILFTGIGADDSLAPQWREHLGDRFADLVLGGRSRPRRCRQLHPGDR